MVTLTKLVSIMIKPFKQFFFKSKHTEWRSICNNKCELIVLETHTTMPMLFFWPDLVCSTVSSMTRFIKGSKPRRTPVTVRAPFSFRVRVLSMYLKSRCGVSECATLKRLFIIHAHGQGVGRFWHANLAKNVAPTGIAELKFCCCLILAQNV